MIKIQRMKGITLISLVVSIIILMILAGISISMLTGENGILKKTREAKLKNEEAIEIESVNLAVSTSKMDDLNTTEITKENLEKNLKSISNRDSSFEIAENNSGDFTIKFNDSNREYYIDKSGEVIYNDNILKISNSDELKKFRDSVNKGNSYNGWYIYLDNDIILDPNEEWIPIGIYNENGEEFLWGYKGYSFKGIFDGKNHKIDKLCINNSSKGQGLFGFITYATIKNIELGEYCNINSNNETGGIVGNALYSNILNSINKSNIVSSGYNVGGIAGVANFSKISNCKNISKVETTQYTIGGIVGNAYSTNIYQCGNIGEIKGKTSNVGGIIGQCNYNQIVECYNQGKVTNNYGAIGGIAGNVTGSGQKICKISNSYNVAEIIGTNEGGGLIGVGESLYITNSYNIGYVNVSNNAGEIIGTKKEDAELNKNFYLDSCIDKPNKIEGSIMKKSEDMKKVYEELGDCFTDDINNINGGYPILLWQK